jgi:hypothetical protein
MEGCPYEFTALIVRAIQMMGKWILPLRGGVSGENSQYREANHSLPDRRVAMFQELIQGGQRSSMLTYVNGIL